MGRIREPAARLETNVAAYIRKARGPDGVAERLEPPVELVVSGRGGIVAEEVHRAHDRIRVLRRDSRKVGGEGVSLNQVTRIDEHHLIGIPAAQGVHHRGRADEPAVEGPILDVIPVRHAAVDVGRGDDDDVRSVLRRGEEGREKKRGEHGGQI